ncbi:putative armadillo-like helical protein [Dioscorea sansibarensis]
MLIILSFDHTNHTNHTLSFYDPSSMVEESTDHWHALARARALIPAALSCARSQPTLTARWSTVVSNLQALPPSLSNLSTHPSFSKSPLCLTLLHSISTTLSHLIHLSSSLSSSSLGKLHLQSHLHSLDSNLQLHLHDCKLLLKTTTISDDEPLTRLQLGDSDSKHRALDELLASMKANEKSVHAAELSAASVAALAGLLTHSTMPKIKEKAVSLLCLLAESESCETSLASSDHLLKSLIKLAESGSHYSRVKSLMLLQRLSIQPDAARLVVAHGGVRVLIEMICEHGDDDSITRSAATATLKNLSVLPAELMTRHDIMVITRVMITIFDSPNAETSKQHAAEFLTNVTSMNESLKSLVISEGAVRSLLSYLDEPLPQEPAISALRNLVDLVSIESLVSLGLFPRLVRILKDGTQKSKQAAAFTIAKLSSYREVQELVGDFGIMDLLVEMINGKTKGSREAAAQAMAGLMSECQKNRKIVEKKKKDCESALPGLVQLLDWNLENRANKYAVACLLCLSRSSKSRRLMIAHGAIGYLKKLTEMGVPGSTELMERLERRKLINLFT